MVVAKLIAFALLVSLSAGSGFDREEWASGKRNYSGKNPRTEMVSDAKAAGVEIGAARAQVRDLLGAPDSSNTEVDTWYLGQSTYAPDYITLDVYYNEKAIVTKIGSTQS
jgi:outer membrane protein assembly factor BamE (lipoprotein component of BamABCDE complex)